MEWVLLKALQIGLSDCFFFYQIDIKECKDIIKKHVDHTIYFVLRTPSMRFDETGKNKYKMTGVLDDLSEIRIEAEYTCSLKNDRRLLEIYDSKNDRRCQLTILEILLKRYSESGYTYSFSNPEMYIDFPSETELPFNDPFEIMYIGKSKDVYDRITKHEKHFDISTDRLLNEKEWKNKDQHILIYNYKNNKISMQIKNYFESVGLKMDGFSPTDEVPESILIDYFKPKFNDEYKYFNKNRTGIVDVTSQGYSRIILMLDCTTRIPARSGEEFCLVLPLETEENSTYNNDTGRYDPAIVIGKDIT